MSQIMKEEARTNEVSARTHVNQTVPQQQQPEGQHCVGRDLSFGISPKSTRHYSKAGDNPSIATGALLTNPPTADATIKKSSYALPEASLTFKDVSFALPISRGESKTILAPCSGHISSGELVALMGPSGSGKTTLLDCLAGKKTAPYKGEVLVNGRPRDHLFRRIAAYVAQEDHMPAHWTCREAIQFNAALKRQPTRAHESVEAWIDILLETFALSSVADTYIGGAQVRGISGGQRRRVVLARGVAAHASLLFCDEPTSGLSATDAELCIRALRTVVKRLGATCVVVIHQPRHEVAMLFDTLMLLTSNPGRMAYNGPMSKAQSYWSACGHPVPMNANPTDYFLDTLTPGTLLDHSDDFVQEFKDRQEPEILKIVEARSQIRGQSVEEMLAPEGQQEKRKALGVHAVPFSTQLRVLLRRKLCITLRNPWGLGLPLFVPLLQGLIVGLMFRGVGERPLLRQVMFAFCLLTMLCLAGTMTVVVLITERTIMKHETSEALYSEAAAALTTILIDVPLSLLGALGNVLIMASMAQLDFQVFETVVAWSLLLFFVYDSLFAFIGAVAVDTRQAQVIATPFISIFMLFNGIIVSKKDAPATLHWIFDISPNAYAMQAIVLDMAEAAGPKGESLLHRFGFEKVEGSNTIGVVMLVSMIIVLRVLQQVGLKFCNKVQR